MATNIINYAPEASPPSPLLAAPSAIPAVSPVLPQPLVMQAPAPAPAAGGLWNGHLKPAEIQIIVIVLIAGLFNAFFLVLSLRLLWRRYQPGPVMAGAPAAALPAPSDEHCNLRRVTPMLVQQPDDQLVYGLKQVLAPIDRPKPPVT